MLPFPEVMATVGRGAAECSSPKRLQAGGDSGGFRHGPSEAGYTRFLHSLRRASHHTYFLQLREVLLPGVLCGSATQWLFTDSPMPSRVQLSSSI